MNRSESIANLAAALAKAQSEFPAVPRNKHVTVTTAKGSYKFSYAPFEDVLRATKEARAKNGLAFVQSATSDSMETILLHSSGEWISTTVPMMVAQAGMQGMGSALTYASRYGFCKAFGIQADDDDDANAADGNTIVEQRKKTGMAAIKEGHFKELNEDEKTWIADLAESINTMVANGQVADAYTEIHHQIPYAPPKRPEKYPEYVSALNGLLEPPTRTALAKYKDSLKEAA